MQALDLVMGGGRPLAVTLEEEARSSGALVARRRAALLLRAVRSKGASSVIWRVADDTAGAVPCCCCPAGCGTANRLHSSLLRGGVDMRDSRDAERSIDAEASADLLRTSLRDCKSTLEVPRPRATLPRVGGGGRLQARAARVPLHMPPSSLTP